MSIEYDDIYLVTAQSLRIYDESVTHLVTGGENPPNEVAPCQFRFVSQRAPVVERLPNGRELPNHLFLSALEQTAQFDSVRFVRSVHEFTIQLCPTIRHVSCVMKLEPDWQSPVSGPVSSRPRSCSRATW